MSLEELTWKMCFAILLAPVKGVVQVQRDCLNTKKIAKIKKRAWDWIGLDWRALLSNLEFYESYYTKYKISFLATCHDATTKFIDYPTLAYERPVQKPVC